MTQEYLEPIICAPWHTPPPTALPLANSGSFFNTVNLATRASNNTVQRRQIPVTHLTGDLKSRAEQFTQIPPPVANLNSRTTLVMSIINLTPDSFHPPSRARTDDIPQLAEKHISDGADILDLGAESTRPGAQEITPEQEWRRLQPALASLRQTKPAPVISIDTRNPELFAAAANNGAQILNDISGFTRPDALKHAAELVNTRPVWLVCMHSQGTPETMQNDPRYHDVTADIHDWFSARLAAMEIAGIPRQRVILDPGFGFGKTLEHNLALLRNLAAFCNLGCPVLAGLSRKSWIGRIDPHPDAQSPAGRLAGSVSAAVVAAAHGASILRVHDPRETRQALAVLDALRAGS